MLSLLSEDDIVNKNALPGRDRRLFDGFSTGVGMLILSK
jgi:tetrahydromethanopterin S-methyltransferase subunit F